MDSVVISQKLLIPSLSARFSVMYVRKITYITENIVKNDVDRMTVNCVRTKLFAIGGG